MALNVPTARLQLQRPPCAGRGACGLCIVLCDTQPDPMRTISIRLDEHTDVVPTGYCERHGLTQTAALKAAIEHLAEARRPTPAELALQFCLVGGFRSGDGSLAEKHFRHLRERLHAKRESDSIPAPATAPASASASVELPHHGTLTSPPARAA